MGLTEDLLIAGALAAGIYLLGREFIPGIVELPRTIETDTMNVPGKIETMLTTDPCAGLEGLAFNVGYNACRAIQGVFV